ncbi:TetR/AcrR family transcriptional regulator [Sphingorhabdus contaminans]|jgi:TetR/AcrR family transcriptional regulator, transcriptional repressor for nem operon|uniref:TetR/AcrR family transcriptional regulator n=1 Tax=Sphingorhabdus contaminans TaxID=1343899 RepID=A0A553W9I6_9SPHN|nr:TetR/AcrR family transcriptional regulator [Sphingorhabdus contaminans]TSB01339.1 TetR/AcrR family transcriptional regulator [Sphingorhabdus contaminans]
MPPSRATKAPPRQVPAAGSARERLIAAAIATVRYKGFSATSVDEICQAAGVTKGAFFHHFASKEALAVEAAGAWTEIAEQRIFTQPDWTRIPDPLERLLGHIDFRLSMLDGPAEDFTCFVGTMVQESYNSSDPIRAACDASLHAYALRLAEDIQQAIDIYGIASGVSAVSLAFHIQAVLQGAFILAKANGNPVIARDSVMHLKRYVVMLFTQN